MRIVCLADAAPVGDAGEDIAREEVQFVEAEQAVGEDDGVFWRGVVGAEVRVVGDDLLA